MYHHITCKANTILASSAPLLVDADLKSVSWTPLFQSASYLDIVNKRWIILGISVNWCFKAICSVLESAVDLPRDNKLFTGVCM